MCPREKPNSPRNTRNTRKEPRRTENKPSRTKNERYCPRPSFLSWFYFVCFVCSVVIDPWFSLGAGFMPSPMTMTEKILARAAGKQSVEPGENVWVNIDVLMTHDVCGPGTFGVFKKNFGENAKVW